MSQNFGEIRQILAENRHQMFLAEYGSFQKS